MVFIFGENFIDVIVIQLSIFVVINVNLYLTTALIFGVVNYKCVIQRLKIRHS